MSVSRRLVITYDAPDEGRSQMFSDLLDALVTGSTYPPVLGITDLAFSSEPVIPPTEPLVGDP